MLLVLSCVFYKKKKDEMNLNNIARSNVQVKTIGESAYLHKSYAQ